MPGMRGKSNSAQEEKNGDRAYQDNVLLALQNRKKFHSDRREIMENRNCGHCMHSYSHWDRGIKKLETRCVGCSEEIPGGLRMIDKIVKWTDLPCENYKPLERSNTNEVMPAN